jgi:perosamine synthetase
VPLIEEDDLRAVRSVMESGWLTTGPKAAEFEKEFAVYVGARHAVAVNSCTAALHVALEAAGVREGDEVIVPTLTFAATAEAVIYLKARPVLLDCEPDTFNLDPMLVERAITPRTRAVIPVHFGGHPCDMARLLAIARTWDLRVIEDAAHALPARYKGKMVGSLGDITCFSFYATKNITTGEGGMAATASDEWADRMRIMRLHGISKDAWKRYTAEGSWRYEILAPGYKYNLTDMQAALGLTQLAKCNAMWARRSQLAQRYNDALSMLGAYELPTTRNEVQHAWHLYVLRVCPGELSIHRNRLIEELKLRGIGTSVHFIPLHMHTYYRETFGYQLGDFPVAEDYFDRCLSLPLYAAMSDADQDRVIDALVEISHKFGVHPYSGFSSYDGEEARKADGEIPNHEAGKSQEDANGQAEEQQTCIAGAKPPVEHTASSGFYSRIGKRMLDCCAAAFGLLALSPVFVLCAAAVKRDSRGPILFRQPRVGRGGRSFQLLKFRTMIDGSRGARITAAGDPRITRSGLWLRRMKLDELPQLINVLRGEMSLVGPRPEVAEYARKYTREQRRVFAYKPGITSPASLTFIDEEEILARQSDRESFYCRVLLPQKLEMDLGYCRECSLMTDMKIVSATLRRLLPGETRSATMSNGSASNVARESGI